VCPAPPREPQGGDEEGAHLARTRSPRLTSSRGDVQESSLRLVAALWALTGAALGVLVGVAAMEMWGWSSWILWVAPPAGWAFVYGVALFITDSAGSAGSLLYAPSGQTTPRKREHSQAESLVVRGRYMEAIDALEVALEEDPRDTGIHFRIARIYRDHLGRPEDAARWFRRVRSEGHLTAAEDLAALREYAELCILKLADPGRVAADLARAAESLQGTPGGEWAARELAHVKRLLHGGEGDG